MVENFINRINFLINSKINFLKIFNLLLSMISILYLIREIITLDFEIEFRYSYLFLIYIFSQFFYAKSWRYLVKHHTKINNKHLEISWLTSVIGRYTPFKVGIPLLRKTFFEESFSTRKLLNCLIREHILTFSISMLLGVLLLFNGLESIQLFFIVFLFFIFKIFGSDYFNYYLISQLISLIFIIFAIYEVTGTINFNLAIMYVFSSGISLLFIGSPAGIGIREAIFLNFLEFSKIDTTFFQVAIILRIITIISDLIIFIIFKFFVKKF